VNTNLYMVELVVNDHGAAIRATPLETPDVNDEGVKET